MYAEPRETRSTALTIPDLLRMKQERQPITSLTAYDASLAALIDHAQIDVILIGDSLGMVVQGHRNTLPVTVDHMVYHCQAVARGAGRTLRIADMPFASYPSEDIAFRNGARLISEGQTAMVKLEGAGPVLPIIEYLASREVPVCAHLGLTPQSVLRLGGFKLQGREEAAAQQLRTDALAAQSAGASLLVLECVPAELAKSITAELTIPTIGIGAGLDCDGQILVIYDILGIALRRRPKFVKNFLEGQASIGAAIAAFRDAVRAREFPGPDNMY